MTAKKRKNRALIERKPQLALASSTPTKHTSVWQAPKVDHLPMLTPDDLPNNALGRTLYMALTMRRDHGSATEAEFVAWLANRLPVSMIDAAGNLHVDMRHSLNHMTLFTAHTDTVHSSGGVNKVRVEVEQTRTILRADGAALGADDGAGVALLCHLIEHGVPGYYIFFRGEERGGIGSSWLAKEMPQLLKQFNRAVAFDRADQGDVITHQSRGRCCSDMFAEALADQLNAQGQLYMPCDTGVYTDTAEFVHLIPECTNLSVGYKNQHGDREQQDLTFLLSLAESIVLVDWDGLPTDRDPNKREPSVYTTRNPFYTGSWMSGGSWRDDVDDKNDVLFERGQAIASAARAELDMTNHHLASRLVMEDDETTLFDALEESMAGDFAYLRETIASHVFPQDPRMATRHMATTRLTTTRLVQAQEMLIQGASASSVADWLYDLCAIA